MPLAKLPVKSSERFVEYHLMSFLFRGLVVTISLRRSVGDLAATWRRPRRGTRGTEPPPQRRRLLP